MKIKGNYYIHNFGIEGFRKSTSNCIFDINRIRYTPDYEELKEGYVSTAKQNQISMLYGNGQTFDFDSNRSYELLLTLFGKETLVNQLGISKQIYDKLCEANGVENVLTEALKGSAIVLVTGKNNSSVVGLTTLDKNGELVAKNTENLFLANPSQKEME